MKRVKIGVKTANIIWDAYYYWSSNGSSNSKVDRAFDSLRLAIIKVERKKYEIHE